MNNIIIKPAIFIVIAIVCIVAPLQAQVPQIINYQGRVAVSGVNFNGTGQFAFALVNTNGTTTYWSNDGTSVAGAMPTHSTPITVTQGLYSVSLGDATLANMTAIPFSVFSNSDVRLRIWFNDGTNGFQQLTPDQRIASVGYAMVAGSVNGQYTLPVGPANFNIVCLGDSITAGVGAVGGSAPNVGNVRSYPGVLQTMSFAAQGAQVYNLGISGQTTSQAVGQYFTAGIYSPSNLTSTSPHALSPAVTGVPAAFLLFYGRNDTGTTPIAQWESEMTTLVYWAHKDGYSPVVVMTIIPGGIPPSTAASEANRLSFNSWILSGGSGADIIADPASLFPMTPPVTAPFSPLYGDNPLPYHPSNIGYTEIAQLVNNSLMSQVNASYTTTPFSRAGILNSWLQADVPFTDVTQSWTAQQDFAKTTSPAAIVVNTYASVGGDAIQLNGASNTSTGQLGFALGGADQWTMSLSGSAGNSIFYLRDAITGNNAFSVAEANDLLSPYGISTQYNGPGASINYVASSTSIPGLTLTGNYGGVFYPGTVQYGSKWQTQGSGNFQFVDLTNGVGQLFIVPGSGTTGGVNVTGTMTANVVGGNTLNIYDASAASTPITAASAYNSPIALASLLQPNISTGGNNWITFGKAAGQDNSTQIVFNNNGGSGSSGNTAGLRVYGTAGLTVDGNSNVLAPGNLVSDSAGAGIQVKEGSNAKQGTATLSDGTVTVSNTAVTANSRIFLTAQNNSGVVGSLSISARAPGTSFTISSTSALDSSTVAWEIFEPAP